MLKVPPEASGVDVRDARYPHAEGGTYGLSAHELPRNKATNLKDILLSQASASVSFSDVPTAAPDAPTFGVHVGDVFFLSSEKQMVRVDAGPIVAAVQNQLTFADGTPRYRPGYTVSEACFALVPEGPIADFVNPSGPRPARFGAPNVGPEARDRIGIHSPDVTLEYS